MDIELVGSGSDRLATDLLRWLRNEQLSGVQIDQKRAAPDSTHMGAELLPIITAVLAAPAVVELLKSLQAWLQTRKPKITLTLRDVSGSTLELNTENADVTSQQLEALIRRSSKGL